MNITNLITFATIGITALVSWRAWEDPALFNRLKFQMNRVLIDKEYDRIFTAGFLHADWGHLFFNMFTLYIFMPVVLSVFSPITTVLIYLASIIGGNLLSVLFHKKELWYSAVGASGGVSGILFTAILIAPNLPLSILFFPFFSFPAWSFGLIFLGYSLFGIKNRMDNIGHAAHLGGSLVGLVGGILLKPQLLQAHHLYILIMLVPIAIMGYLAYQKK